MNSEDLKVCGEYVKDLILKCGEILKEGFTDCGEVMTKGHHMDVVTVYDQRIENMLMGGIKEKYPDHLFIAEEQTAVSNQQLILTSQPTWIIDPIDGTSNFVQKIPFVCISVALAINEELVLGFLYNPLTQEFFTAQKDGGAFLNDVQIKVNHKKELKNSTIAFAVQFGRMSFLRPTLYARMNSFYDNSMNIKNFGSAALDLGYLAKGTFDCVISEHLKPWDVAAGALIVMEAGGVVIDTKSGEKFKIMQPNVISACNINIALKIKKILDDVNEKMERDGTSVKQLYGKYNESRGLIKKL